MNLSRIFANAIARRVAYVVVALAFAALASLFGIADAHAATTTCPNVAPHCNRGEAYADAVRQANQEAASACFAQFTDGIHSVEPTHAGSATNGSYSPRYMCINKTTGNPTNSWQGANMQAAYHRGCPVTAPWNDLLKVCSECNAGAQTPTFPSMIGVYQCPTGQCARLAVGCSATGPTPNHVCWETVGGAKCTGNEPCPSGYTKDPNSGMCMPPEECPEGTVRDADGNCLPPGQCPEGQVKDQFGLCKPKGSECPAGQIQSPEGNCLPGEGQCDAGFVRGKDGTCKRDADGDGKADDEDGDGDDTDGNGEGDDESTFSGGENCEVPPACAGDNILCGQARIQWRIDCNTRRQANISGGSCQSPPVCAGKCDPLDYQILVVNWRTACAMERMGNENGTDGGGDGPSEGFDVGSFAEGVVDAEAGDGAGGCDVSEGEECGIGTREIEIGGELDDSGLGWSRSCPSLPVVQFMDSTVDFNTIAGGKMCDWMQLGGQFVLILAAALSLRIMTGGMG